jgi:hypothetical protein
MSKIIESDIAANRECYDDEDYCDATPRQRPLWLRALCEVPTIIGVVATVLVLVCAVYGKAVAELARGMWR